MTVDTSNEMAVLAQAYVSKENRDLIVSILKPGDFLDAGHRRMMWLLRRCHMRGVQPKRETLMTFDKENPFAKGRGELDEKLMSALDKFTALPHENVEEHCRVVREDGVRHQLGTTLLPGIQTQVEGGYASLSEIATGLRGAETLISLGVGASELNLLPMGDWMTRYAEFAGKREKGEGFYTTGFRTIDDVLVEGLAPGKVSVWSGRSSMGKSSFVQNMSLRLAYYKVPVGMFTLEMPSYSLIDRFVAIRTGVEIMRMTKPDGDPPLSKNEKRSIEWERERLHGLPHLYMDDSPAVSLDYIRDQVRRLQAKLGTQYLVVIVDLFGKIRDIRADYMAASYEENLNRAQQMARDLGIHLALVAQIRREKDIKNIWAHRPTLNQVKNSGAWEEVADLVVMFFRAKYYDPKLVDDVLEVHIAKQRMGAKDDRVNFLFKGAQGRITETKLRPYDQRV